VSRARGPSSAADPVRGGVQPSGEADLARGGALSPRARQTAPEGVLSRQARQTSSEGAFSFAALAGRGGHQGRDRVVCVFWLRGLVCVLRFL
jgi:hypothetical protein